MRRVFLALVATVTGTTLLVGLKSPGFGGSLGLAAEAPIDPGVTDPGVTGDGVTGGTDPVPAGPSAKPGTTPRPGTTPSPGASTATAKPTATKPTSTSTTTTAPASQTFTGAFIAVKTAQSPSTKSSPCGDCHAYSMAVTITVSGGRIIKTTTAFSTSPGSSGSYANRAINKLAPAILTAQSWNLGRVSGATYSGNAWELSVRDAMAKAGLPT